MNYQYLLKHPDLFQYVIGITHQQFELLLPKFAIALRRAESVKAWNKQRAREPGAGRKPSLATDRRRLVFPDQLFPAGFGSEYSDFESRLS